MHTIVIPHRDRNPNLALCLWSIVRSAGVCGVTDYEVLVIDAGSKVRPEDVDHNIIVVDADPIPPGGLFNKPKLLNLGLDSAIGDSISLLDADAVVGPRWFASHALLLDPTLTLLFYRVRLLKQETVAEAREAEDPEPVVDDWFARYDTFRRAFESYGPDPLSLAADDQNSGPIVFGNSQMSFTRETLGSLRFDEAYEGAGLDDVHFVREMWRKFGDKYRGAIMLDADHAMFHQHSFREPDWGDKAANRRNEQRYHAHA